MISHENHEENIHSIKKTWTTSVPWEKSVSEALPGARLGDLLWWRTHHLCRCQLVVWWGSNRWKPEKKHGDLWWFMVIFDPMSPNIWWFNWHDFSIRIGISPDLTKKNEDSMGIYPPVNKHIRCGLLAYLVGWLTH